MERNKAVKNFYKTICRSCAVVLLKMHKKDNLNEENIESFLCSKCLIAYKKLKEGL